MVQELRSLVRDKRRYALEAYLFLYQSLERAQQLAKERRHVSGQELLEGFRILAGELFGPLALMVLETWGLRRTEDVGHMVFDLVDRELMGKTPDDKIEDFQDVYDFQEVFASDVMMAQVDPTNLVPTVRLVRRDLPAAGRPALQQRS
jgi:uncharacterized repeat protein (TIGR04138 family)